MKFDFLLLFLILAGISSCSTTRSNTIFSVNEEIKTSLGNEGNAEFFYWDFDDTDDLWSYEIGSLKGIEVFRDTLRSILGEEMLNKVITKESTRSLDKQILLKELDGDRRNALLVHTGSLGNIRPINRLEAQILNYQLLKYDLIKHPTEFHGFIAYNEMEKSYRVYFGASDQPWPPRPTLLLEQLDQDIKNGWQLKYHLHNHYEPASNDYMGILAPSMADAQYFKMLLEKYNLEKALITNGYHTVVIESKDFDKFESH